MCESVSLLDPASAYRLVLRNIDTLVERCDTYADVVRSIKAACEEQIALGERVRGGGASGSGASAGSAHAVASEARRRSVEQVLAAVGHKRSRQTTLDESLQLHSPTMATAPTMAMAPAAAELPVSEKQKTPKAAARQRAGEAGEAAKRYQVRRPQSMHTDELRARLKKFRHYLADHEAKFKLKEMHESTYNMNKAKYQRYVKEIEEELKARNESLESNTE